MQVKLSDFNSLSLTELYDVLQLRCDVFVVEQKCPYPDLDDKDQQSLHVLGYEGKELAAYARLLPPGLSHKEAAIGRVVTSQKHRGKDFGKEIMKASVKFCLDKFQTDEIIISAQTYLHRFYTELGFVKEGEGYLEDDIPHVKMRYRV